MGVEETIKEIASELERIANTRTVVGEPESLLLLPEKQLFRLQKFRLVLEPVVGKAKRITTRGTEEGEVQAQR